LIANAHVGTIDRNLGGSIFMQNSHNSMYNNPENGQKEHKDTAGLDRDLSLSPGISSGFYRTADEHDACGIGIVADLKKGQAIV